MTFLKSASLLALLSSVICLMLGGSSAAQPPAPAEDRPKAIRELVNYLDAPDPLIRRRAEIQLEGADARDLPTLRGLANNDDLTRRQKQALTLILSRVEPRVKLYAKRHERELISADWMRQVVLMDRRPGGVFQVGVAAQRAAATAISLVYAANGKSPTTSSNCWATKPTR
jgi:hypothetical protein